MTSQNPGCLAVIFGIRAKPRIQKRVLAPQPVIETPAGTDALVPINEISKTAARYSSKGILLTNAEVPFFHLLRRMARDHLIIFPHVALRDLVSVVADQSEYFTYFNKIDRKQIDFVLCEPESLKPVFAIELDDASHNRPDRRERDIFVETILEEAKIPLVRIPVRNNYDVEELSDLFQKAVGRYVAQKNENPSSLYTIDNPPLCRKHGVRMVLRTARQSGQRFWGCPNYPQCREIIKLVE
jgi:hypothetical protein